MEISLLLVTAAGLSLSACATQRQTTGTATGPVAGAVVGCPVGAVAGGAIGAVVTAPGAALGAGRCYLTNRQGRVSLIAQAERAPAAAEFYEYENRPLASAVFV